MAGEADAFLERLRAEVLAAVREELPRLVTPPRVLTVKLAAAELSVSESKLKGLIKAGAVGTVLVGKTKMVPRSEIERIEASVTRDAPKVRTSGGRPKATRYSAKAESEAFAAGMRARRGR